MPSYLKPLWRLFSPLVLLLLSVYAVFDIDRLDLHYQPLLVYLPYPILMIALFFSLQFNRLRLFACVVLLLLAYVFIQSGLQQSLEEPRASFLYSGLSFLLPLSLCALALLPDRGIRSVYGVAVIAALSLLAGLLWLAPVEQLPAPQTLSVWLALKPTANYLMSYGASALFVISACTIFTLLCYRNAETEACLLVCLLATYLTLVMFYQAYISAILFGCCGLCIIVCLFRSTHDMAFRDDLTGLNNRRAFNDRLRSLGRRYVIATADVDHFKKFNDTHGHEVGDEVLKLVASHIDNVAGGGVAYRYGGEEFCIVFSGANIDGCLPHLEKVREDIAAYKITLRQKSSRPVSNKQGSGQRGAIKKSKTVSVTISIGVAERQEACRDADQVLKASDKALYKAKKQGRNCVVAL